MGRFSPAALFRAHWKSLSDYRSSGPPKPDWFSRVVVLAIPLATFVLLVWRGRPASNDGTPETIVLAALALLAGGLLGAFTHLSGVRQRLQEREATWGEGERTRRDSMDETAAHLLVGSYLSFVSSVLFVVSWFVQGGCFGRVVFAAAAATAVYVVLVFLIAIPRLYVAYAETMEVRDEMSGLHH